MSFAHLISRFMGVFGGYCSQIVPNLGHRTAALVAGEFHFAERTALSERACLGRTEPDSNNSFRLLLTTNVSNKSGNLLFAQK